MRSRVTTDHIGDKDRLTVVTVVYNDSAHLEQTIESVINQTYTNIQYIVIDGGSNDGTVEIIKKYSKHIAYWISEPDQGIYDAMNKGVCEADGKWISFMNSGDQFYSKNSVTEVFECSLFGKADLVYGDVKLISEKGEQLVKTMPLSQIKHRGLPFCHQSLFCKTELLKNNPFDLNYRVLADYDFALKCYLGGNKYQYVDQIVSKVLDGGVSKTDWFNVYREMRKIKLSHRLNKIEANVYFLKLMLARVLRGIGLGSLVTLYSSLKSKKDD